MALKSLDELKPKELAVLDGLIDGLSNKQIALRLNIGVRTVELRRANLRRRMGCKTAFEMGMTAMRLMQQPVLEPPAQPHELAGSF